MQAGTRVLMNTGFLYAKMLITMVITLYSTRLILDALGAEDYGIFNLVAGVILMLSFLNSAMSVSTQRYLSFYLGAKENQKLKAVFNSSVLLHLIIGLLIVVILELVGIYLFENVLNIPIERIDTAKKVFHFMVISTFFTINAVPYDASINAHENMFFDAVVGILETLMKFGIAIWLTFSNMDRLILYGILVALVTILMRVIKSVYCYYKYEECRIQFKGIDMSLLKEMFSFAGWNLVGSFCNVVRNQGLAVILNMFLGVVVNAAYGIAHQINAQLASFSTNMLKALNPQIAKSEGGGERERMLMLAKAACKFSFFLLAFFAIPLIIEMEYVLALWLKDVPDNTIIFCQLILLISLIQMLSRGLMSAIQSVGKIRGYMSAIGALLILNLPLAYILLKMKLPAYSVLLGSLGLEIIAGGTRIWFANKLAGLNSKEFLVEIIFRPTITFIIVFSISLIPTFLLKESFLRVMATSLISTISILLLAKLIMLSQSEFIKLKQLVFELFNKFASKLKR